MSDSSFTSGQVARMLGIPPRTIRAYLASGRLKAQQNPVTGRWRVSRQQLIQFMRDNGMDPEHLERQVHIFIVERDEDRKGQICSALADGPWKTQAFDSCATALISMGAQAPDLLILDSWGSEEHCAELVRAIRDHERTRQVPILLLSATEQLTRELWPEAALLAPSATEQLRREVENLLLPN